MEGRVLWEVLSAPEEIEAVAREFSRPQVARFPHRRVMTLKTREGGRRRVSWSCSAALSRDGSLAYIFCTGMEIRTRAGGMCNLAAGSEGWEGNPLVDAWSPVLEDALLEAAFSLDYHRLLATIPRLLVPALAAWCALDLYDERDGRRRDAVAHRDPALEPQIWELERRYPSTPDVPLDGVRCVSSVNELETSGLIRDPDHRELLEFLGGGAFVSLPLQAGGGLIGALLLCLPDRGRVVRAEEKRWLEAFARRVALAIDAARRHLRMSDRLKVYESRLEVVIQELRTPLSALDLVTRRSSAMADAADALIEVAEELRTIRCALRQVHRFVEDLFEPSDPPEDTLAIRVRPNEAWLLAREAVDLVRPIAAARSVVLELEVEPFGALVVCDRERILQVFSHLLASAIGFTPEGGTIRIGLRRQGGELEFSIQDGGGPGPRSAAPFASRRCLSVDPAPTYGGHLAAHVTQAIIDAHGGRIWRESPEGDGQTVRFTLPARERSGSRAPLGTRRERYRERVPHIESSHAQGAGRNGCVVPLFNETKPLVRSGG